MAHHNFAKHQHCYEMESWQAGRVDLPNKSKCGQWKNDMRKQHINKVGIGKTLSPS